MLANWAAQCLRSVPNQKYKHLWCLQSVNNQKYISEKLKKIRYTVKIPSPPKNSFLEVLSTPFDSQKRNSPTNISVLISNWCLLQNSVNYLIKASKIMIFFQFWPQKEADWKSLISNFWNLLMTNQKSNFTRICKKYQLEKPSKVEQNWHMHKRITFNFHRGRWNFTSPWGTKG